MNPGHYKIKIIKIIKDFTNIGLGEAKMLVDSTDRECIYTGSAEKAYELRNRLEEEGAQATVEFSGADAKIEEELTDISAGEFYKNYVNPFINHILTYGTDIKTVS